VSAQTLAKRLAKRLAKTKRHDAALLLRMPSDMKQQMEKVARLAGVSVSEMLRQLFADALESAETDASSDVTKPPTMRLVGGTP
jgi:hypothetical protein